jgi:hypothetical protein
MLFQPLRLGLIVESKKLTPTIAARLHLPKIFIKVRNINDIKRIIELLRLIEIEGIYTTLSTIFKSRIIKELTELGEFKILLELDKEYRTSAVREFISSMTYVHEVIPVVNICRRLDNIYVTNIPTITSLVIDVSANISKDESRITKNVNYLKDILNSVLKSKNLTIGVVISKIGMNFPEILKDILMLSSYIFVRDSIEDILILQNIFEKYRSTSSLIQAILQILRSEDVKVEVNIE